MTRYAALLFALVIASLGVLGLAAPETFLIAMQFFQSSQRIYLAAALRVVIGVVFIVAATDSRWPRVVRFAGGLVVLLGLLTPVSTHPLPTVTWGWWPGNFVRPWALSTLALGALVVAAVAPPRDIDD